MCELREICKSLYPELHKKEKGAAEAAPSNVLAFGFMDLEVHAATQAGFTRLEHSR